MIDGLAQAVSQNRTALLALTTLKNYDNYTFTHMVNVSILTMGQARALGIDGPLLREFGLAALMHDIGKVRTPLEILNKPDKLTDDEFTIMKRHTVDGAEILRGTPDIPTLAPVVAFEHHLRLDGSGYPARHAAVAEPRDDAVQHRGRVRRDALAAPVPAGLPDGPHPRRAEARRRTAVRSAPGPPVRSADRHLSGREPRAAEYRRDGRRRHGVRSRSPSSSGEGDCGPLGSPRGVSVRSESLGTRRRGRRSLRPSSRQSIRPWPASTR